MADEPTTREWIHSLLEPGQIWGLAVSYYVRVCAEAVFQRGQILAPLLQVGKLRDEAFGRFWVAFTSNREEPTPQPQPPKLCSSDLIPPILSKAHGLVLDVGPGTGTQMPLLTSPSIKAIYGAEPCTGLHGELRARAKKEGLEGKYSILGCSVVREELGVELERVGLVTGEEGGGGCFDTILCVRVLCSVPDLKKTVDELYALLKPGGQILITEHVVNPWRTSKGSLVARIMQAVYGLLGWSFFVGDCCMDRDTETFLKRAADGDGGWEVFDIERSFGRGPLPYISGVLVKKG